MFGLGIGNLAAACAVAARLTSRWTSLAGHPPEHLPAASLPGRCPLPRPLHDAAATALRPSGLPRAAVLRPTGTLWPGVPPSARVSAAGRGPGRHAAVRAALRAAEVRESAHAAAAIRRVSAATAAVRTVVRLSGKPTLVSVDSGGKVEYWCIAGLQAAGPQRLGIYGIAAVSAGPGFAHLCNPQRAHADAISDMVIVAGYSQLI